MSGCGYLPSTAPIALSTVKFDVATNL